MNFIVKKQAKQNVRIKELPNKERGVLFERYKKEK